MIKLFSTSAAAFLVLLLFSAPLGAVRYPPKPADTDWFVDTAGIIDAAAAQSINQIAERLWKDTSIPVYVATIVSLANMEAANYSIENYATALFNSWGIGSQNRNYGMLLLVSKGDRRVRIELGARWGHKFDREMKDIIETLIIPEFKRGNFGAGIVGGVRGLNSVVRGLDLPKPKTPWWFWTLAIVAALGFIATIISLFRSGRSGWTWLVIAAFGGLFAYIFTSLLSDVRLGGRDGGDDSSRSYDRNDGDSSSSDGFGGGSSDGGGASGEW